MLLWGLWCLHNTYNDKFNIYSQSDHTAHSNSTDFNLILNMQVLHFVLDSVQQSPKTMIKHNTNKENHGVKQHTKLNNMVL